MMDRYDVLLIAGIMLTAIGLGLIYFPLGLIATGCGCIALSVIGARGLAGARPAHSAPAQNVATGGKDKA